MDIPTSDNKSLKERLVHSKYRNTWVFILCCFVITVPTHNSPYAPENKHTNTNPYTPGKRRPPPPLTERYTLGALNGYPETNEQSTGAHYTSNYLNPQGFSSRQPVIYSTPKDVFTGIPLKTFTATNQQLVTRLTKKNLLKCHLHVFNGDVAMLHSWKRSFKVMVKDANIAADQELNYLRSYISGVPLQLVENYRKRQGTLTELWTELETRFGNVTALLQALIEWLSTVACLSEKDGTTLQKLADFCADVDCQETHWPGLACLNYTKVTRPITEKLPASLRFKCEKKIVQYAEEHNDTYPTFCEFSMKILCWSAVSDDEGHFFWSWVVCAIFFLFVYLNNLFFFGTIFPFLFAINHRKSCSKRHFKNIILLNTDLCACVCVRACVLVFFNE